MTEAQDKDKTLIIVDDDAPFRNRLARAMEARGFKVTSAEGVASARALAREGKRPMPSWI